MREGADQRGCRYQARKHSEHRSPRIAPLVGILYGLPASHLARSGKRPRPARASRDAASSIKFTFNNGREELYEAGDAYYAPPGHLPYLFAGSEVVEFSPSAELQETLAVVERNMEAATS